MPTPQTAWSPLEPQALSTVAGPAWSVTLLENATSTNAVAAENPVAGTIVVADHQTAGRGRLDRSWETPPGTALTFSAVVDPRLDDADWPLLPLAVALAVAEGVRRATGVDVALKWPNDLLLDDLKVAGILLERVQPAGGRPLAVVGIGINVGMAAHELPVPTATSLALAGADVDRTAVFGAVAQALGAELAELSAGPAAVLDRYRAACSTVGRTVRVDLPDGTSFTGAAEAVDDRGRLVVDGRVVGAGDVVHVRVTDGAP
ncbi:biotin--[acetyl-CoA-carboxylase] ligase [Marmoricola sp. RAF53]|uniref:biotin--[acetyl-CoA-carboxylase] ligase n=1 Tax=Marmoricola sp. RAF53 TaxID=3233059 RepID=UPI003F97A383